MFPAFISDDIQAIYDAWFIEDKFLKDVFNTFQEQINKAFVTKRNRDAIQPYLNDYYNVHGYFTSSVMQDRATGRILNVLIEVLNQKQIARQRLPRFLVVVLDKDIIADLNSFKVGAVKNLATLVNWLTCQIDIVIWRKRLQIADKKPV